MGKQVRVLRKADIKSAINSLVQNDPRDNAKLISFLGVASLIVFALILRWKLSPVVNSDYALYYIPWYDHLKQDGLAGFRESFANYNFPYLFLMFLATLLPLGKVVAIKLISIVFDFVLAYAVYRIVELITKSKARGAIGFFGLLFLPTVFLNSSLWGQCDSIYVSFVMLSLPMLLKGRHRLTWVLFGVAFTFKLQAIFFLPVLMYVWLKKKGDWKNPLLVIPTFILLSIPPVLFGQPIKEALTVYARQYGYQPILAANTPNMQYWLPQGMFDIFNSAGLAFSAAIVGACILFSLRYIKYSKKNLLWMTTFFLLLLPYILPQMHDRYFYGFEVMTLLLTILSPKLLWLTGIVQLITVSVYAGFIMDGSRLPFSVLAVALFGVFVYVLFRFTKLSNYHHVKSMIEDE